eukprot:6270687-Amphidinium_carterae.1
MAQSGEGLGQIKLSNEAPVSSCAAQVQVVQQGNDFTSGRSMPFVGRLRGSGDLLSPVCHVLESA